MTPRLGFLGTGWIGRNRMEAMLATGLVEAAAICDPSRESLGEAAKLAPDATITSSLETMLDLGVDGVVIATPSALHAEQAITALESGAAVFCQKPLARNAAEAQAVVDAARMADRLLGIDLSYRHTEAMQAIRSLVREGALGQVFAIDLTFHNAYGPDKPWFYDRELSGGGCLIDLGVHLVDLALWVLDFPDVDALSGQTLRDGRERLRNEVEDYAAASFRAGSAEVRLTCSWRLNAGRDAVIKAAFYGTEGGAMMRNVNGSFLEFVADRFSGTESERVSGSHDDWSGRASVGWARQLALSPNFDRDAVHYIRSARVLDGIYAAAARR